MKPLDDHATLLSLSLSLLLLLLLLSNIVYGIVVSTFTFRCYSSSKWKADKHGVSCIRLGPKGNTLLSAGRNIKLWDLETKEMLRVRNKFVVCSVSFKIKQNKLLLRK